MKKIAGLVIILALLVLGGYYGMGIMTERAIKRHILVVNQANGLVADVTQYHRGFFCSNAVIKWALHVPEQIEKDANGQAHTVPAQDYVFETPIKISHGPIIFADHTVRLGMGYAQSTMTVPTKYSKQLDEMYTNDSVKPQLDFSVFVSYLNRTVVNLSVPTFKLMAKAGNSTIAWNGMDITTSLTSDLDKISGSVQLNGVNFDKDNTVAALGKVTSEYDLHKTAADLYLGDANFALSSFDISVKGQKVLAVKEVTFDTGSDVDDDLFNAHFMFGLNSLFVSEQTFGPGTLKIAIRNLDAKIVAKMHAQALAVQNGTEIERQQAMLAMLPELPKLFSKGAEFEISRLTFSMPQGMIEGEMKIALPAGESDDPFALLQKVHGSAKLKMPQSLVKLLMQHQFMQQMSKTPELQKALADQLQSQSGDKTPLTEAEVASMQADKQLAGMQQSGLIVADKADYKVDLSLEQGKFVINGKAFDPSMLKF